MRVMVVDDEAFICHLLTRQLARLDYHEVLSFESAPEALALLQQDPGSMDMVFCDLQMPDMDGVEFVRQLVKIGFQGGLVLGGFRSLFPRLFWTVLCSVVWYNYWIY